MAEAVVRELEEETGLEGVCDGLVGVHEHVDDDAHYVILAYEVLLPGGDEPVAGERRGRGRLGAARRPR